MQLPFVSRYIVELKERHISFLHKQIAQLTKHIKELESTEEDCPCTFQVFHCGVLCYSIKAFSFNYSTWDGAVISITFHKRNGQRIGLYTGAFDAVYRNDCHADPDDPCCQEEKTGHGCCHDEYKDII